MLTNIRKNVMRTSIVSATIIMCVLLTGCTAPKAIQKNNEAGQIVVCGSSANHFQNSDDTDCVINHMDLRFIG